MEDQQIIRLFFERSEQAITELSRKYGALYDASGSYNSTFFLIIGLAAAGVLCSLAISAIDRKRK